MYLCYSRWGCIKLYMYKSLNVKRRIRQTYLTYSRLKNQYFIKIPLHVRNKIQYKSANNRIKQRVA